MKRLSITQLVPGMTVAEDVYDLDHELLIQKGTILTDKLITKLDLYGILTIFVEDIIQPVRPAEDSTDTELSYSERIKSSPEFQLFKTDFENDVELFRENMNLVIQKNTSLDVNTLLKNTMAIVANHSGSISILDMLQNMREYDDSTYTHSLNVALICNILAGWLKLSDEEIELATACGLFHDIGKLLIPYSIISKPGKLSEEEFATIKKHPTLGYQLLLSQDVDDHVKNAALMHHERSNGSGYPLKLKGNQIDPYARIVAIADVYDAMTAAPLLQRTFVSIPCHRDVRGRRLPEIRCLHPASFSGKCGQFLSAEPLSVKRWAERDDHLYQQRQALPACRTMWRRVCEPGGPAGFRDCASALSYSGISHTGP